jgi:hypothetical protein
MFRCLILFCCRHFDAAAMPPLLAIACFCRYIFCLPAGLSYLYRAPFLVFFASPIRRHASSHYHSPPPPCFSAFRCAFIFARILRLPHAIIDVADFRSFHSFAFQVQFSPLTLFFLRHRRAFADARRDTPTLISMLHFFFLADDAEIFHAAFFHADRPPLMPIFSLPIVTFEDASFQFSACCHGDAFFSSLFIPPIDVFAIDQASPKLNISAPFFTDFHAPTFFSAVTPASPVSFRFSFTSILRFLRFS